MFWSTFWGLKSAAFSDLESFVIMSKLIVAIIGDQPYFEVFVGMSKVRERAQPLSCSGHKRNGCRAQPALPPMMSGLDSCLRAT